MHINVLLGSMEGPHMMTTIITAMISATVSAVIMRAIHLEFEVRKLEDQIVALSKEIIGE